MKNLFYTLGAICCIIFLFSEFPVIASIVFATFAAWGIWGYYQIKSYEKNLKRLNEEMGIA